MRLSASDVVLDGVRVGDAGWLIMRDAKRYAEDEGFDASFEPLVARIVAGFFESHDPAREHGWIARAGVRRLGSIVCVEGPDPDTAKLRLFYLEREARGLGPGHRLLGECLAFARAAGYRHMTLGTHDSHHAACVLHAKNGFACVRSEPVQSFGTGLIEQEWARDP